MDETREEYIKRLAYNRWEMRQTYKWKLWETDKDDYHVAEEMVREEDVRDDAK